MTLRNGQRSAGGDVSESAARPDALGEEILVVATRAAVEPVLRSLTRAGRTIVRAISSAHAKLLCERRDFALILVEMPITDGSGLAVFHANAEKIAPAPMLLLADPDAGPAAEGELVNALALCNGDYIIGGFSSRELLFRVDVALRRTGLSAQLHRSDRRADNIAIGPIVIDSASHMVLLDGEPCALTETELQIITYLARHAGRVCSHAELLRALWGNGFDPGSQTLRTHLTRVRAKLGQHRDLIQSVRGVGLRLMIRP